MKSFELIAPCHFGLEAVLKKEITDLGYDVNNVDDGRVTFVGDNEAIARVNIWSRTAERVWSSWGVSMQNLLKNCSRGQGPCCLKAGSRQTEGFG